MKSVLITVSAVTLVMMLQGCKDGEGTAASAPAATTAKPGKAAAKDPTDAISTITQNRELARGAAARLDRRFKSDSQKYDKANSLYDTARAANTGYVAAITYALKYNKPLNTQAFTDKAKECATATKNLTDYADSAAGEAQPAKSKFAIAAVGPLITALVDAGTKIYDAYVTRVKKERDDRADWVQKQLEWPKWSDAVK